jgi:5-methylcytosine-specific restriction enzyme A
MQRPCLECGKPCQGSRCPTHQAAWKANRNARPQWKGNWPTVARNTIAAYRATHGDICPGWGHDPHPIAPTQWTCDHDLGPMCRSCNGRKGAVHDRPRHQT